MNRFLLLVAVAFLVPVRQSAAPARLAIAWQPLAVPFGGGAESVLANGDYLLANSYAPGLSVWWLSPDRGRSWTLATGRLGGAWSITPLSGELFVRDFDGIHRTADFGRSWLSCGLAQGDHRAEGRLIAAGRALLYWEPGTDLRRSKDRCATWASVQAPWGADRGPLEIIGAPDAGLLLVHTLRGWFRSSDDGESWTVAAGPAGQPLPSASGMVFGRHLVLGTTRGVFRSTDGGTSWIRLGFDRWVRSVATVGGIVYAALDGDDASPVRSAIVRTADGGRTWVPADEGLYGHRISDLARDAGGTVYAAGAMGVFRLGGSGRWEHIGLPAFELTFLFAAPWGDIFLGTNYGRNTYRSGDRGASWRPLLLPDGLAASMTATRRGDLLVARGNEVLRSRDRGDTWEPSDPRANVRTLFTVPDTGEILAATSNSVFRSTDDGITWVEHAAGTSDDPCPLSFAGAAGGQVYVGTADGSVYLLGDRREPWRSLGVPMDDGGAVDSLASLSTGDLLAGADFGLYRWRPRLRRWDELPLSAEERPRVRAVLSEGRGRLVAATNKAGVFVSSDDGRTWMPANRGLATRRISSMVVTPGGEFFATAGRNVPDFDDLARVRVRMYHGRIVRN